MLTLEGKVTSYDYYSALEKLTDNLGSVGVQVSFSDLLQWIQANEMFCPRTAIVRLCES